MGVFGVATDVVLGIVVDIVVGIVVGIVVDTEGVVVGTE